MIDPFRALGLGSARTFDLVHALAQTACHENLVLRADAAHPFTLGKPTDVHPQRSRALAIDARPTAA